MSPPLKATVAQPIKGCIVKTTDIDLFLNCDDMSAEELMRVNDQYVASKQMEEEEDPEWGSIDVQDIKKSKVVP